ncbi:CDP-diacylglycerol--glycerol-3-phosphate 3-phosphatidyltransferase [Microbotryomycetes sp. JL221]|nr:CDP-diacylglycerol--glycerol-3-phosphate 3-phosphatidyltransferase [Microbotryomycetes sp. JL221]
MKLGRHGLPSVCELVGRQRRPSATTRSCRVECTTLRRHATGSTQLAWQEFNHDLHTLPTFQTTSDNLDILIEPRQFYQRLLQRIRQARHRIFIASLYIGKEEHELIDTLASSLERNPQLQVTILLDYLRSTRELPRPCSASLAASLVARFPKQCQVRLYHTPNLNGWQKLIVPRRFDEGWGLQHMKCYGVDDNVIMSGANLSNDYFTNRQDRYIEFTNNQPIADYFDQLVKLTNSFSFQTLAQDTTTRFPKIDIVWPSNNIVDKSFLSTSLLGLRSKSKLSELKSRANESLNALTNEWRSKSTSRRSSSSPSDTYDTVLRPVIQMGTFDIRQETNLVIPTIFKLANRFAEAPNGWKTTIDWTSGYFSVQERYQQLVLESKSQVRLVSASPAANGFTGSRGVSKYIPPAYTHLQRMFYDQANKRANKFGKENHITIREWRKQDWTYHAKGIWLSPSLPNPIRNLSTTNLSPFNDANDNDLYFRHFWKQPVSLSYIGSSNYGQRSAQRDLEANVLLTTTNKRLQQRLTNEVEHVRQDAIDQVNDRLFNKKDRRVKEGVKIAAKLIRDML